MFEKGLFGGLFDFNNDGKLDSFEQAAEFATVMHFAEESQKQNDNSNYSSGNFYSYTDDTDETEQMLSDAGLDMLDLELMDDDERTQALEDAGLDPDDFDFWYRYNIIPLGKRRSSEGIFLCIFYYLEAYRLSVYPA